MANGNIADGKLGGPNREQNGMAAGKASAERGNGLDRAGVRGMDRASTR